MAAFTSITSTLVQGKACWQVGQVCCPCLGGDSPRLLRAGTTPPTAASNRKDRPRRGAWPPRYRRPRCTRRDRDDHGRNARSKRGRRGRPQLLHELALARRVADDGHEVDVAVPRPRMPLSISRSRNDEMVGRSRQIAREDGGQGVRMDEAARTAARDGQQKMELHSLGRRPGVGAPEPRDRRPGRRRRSRPARRAPCAPPSAPAASRPSLPGRRCRRPWPTPSLLARNERSSSTSSSPCRVRSR